MRNLLYKEFTLSAMPITYIFLAFSAMALIPGYPILVGAFFVCLGIFYTYQTGRENSDVFYSVLLPVKKIDTVTAKFAFAVIIQTAAFVLSAVFATVNILFLSQFAPYAENVMMNGNLAYLGYYLIIFALFNGVFIGGFFKTAYKIGKPFVIFAISAFVAVGLFETLHHIPTLEFLNGYGADLIPQCMVLAVGILCYTVVTALSLNASRANFAKIDL